MIALDLDRARNTFERHLSSIFRKLALPPGGDGLRRVLAVLTYLRAGLTWAHDRAAMALPR